MVVQSSLGVTTVAEFIKYAQANPGKLNCGHPGNGTPSHLAAALFNVMAKVKIEQIQYKGAAQVLADLVAGNIQCQFTSPVVAMPRAKTGRVKVLATTGVGPDPLVPNFRRSRRRAGLRKHAMVRHCTARTHAKSDRGEVPFGAHARAAFVGRGRTAEKTGASVQPESPAAFAQYIRDERNRIAGLAKSAGIRID